MTHMEGRPFVNGGSPGTICTVVRSKCRTAETRRGYWVARRQRIPKRHGEKM